MGELLFLSSFTLEKHSFVNMGDTSKIGAAALASAAAFALYNTTGPKQTATVTTEELLDDEHNPKPESKYQAGEAYDEEDVVTTLTDPKAIAAALLRDHKALHGKFSLQDLTQLVYSVTASGKPIDDRASGTEKLIDLLTTLSETSPARSALTSKFVESLWRINQHPPLSYVGGDAKYEISSKEQAKAPATDSIDFKIKVGENDYSIRQSVPQPPNGMFQYRSPDGSYNNPFNPNLGKASTPYAKTVRSVKRLHGVRPDPGLLFDLLMARDETKFKENPAGLSSMLFYHAGIMIHDVFRTNRTDANISDVSSYLDLAPLYGSSLKDQLQIRTMSGGKLKPDTFAERRLLGQPPAINVILVLYSRFHNYVADILLKINEGGRFTLTYRENKAKSKEENEEAQAKALAKQDHDLFNTARLITCGLYVNIFLHDYLRGLTNTHSSNSNWVLDARADLNKMFDDDGVPKGLGHQVSAESNLISRLHSCISKKDEDWLNRFFLGIFPDRTVDNLNELSTLDLLKGLAKFEARIDPDPSKREFDTLKRQADGTFNNDDLTRVLKEGIEDPAGAFGPRMVPKALRVVEVLGIMQGRKWGVASLNEYRAFMGLEKYDSFGQMTSDKEIAALLERLYTHPDMVELYPGIVVEDIKPVRNAGSGICAPYTAGRSMLADAVTLVRADRFNTVDFTAANLTNWGFCEIKPDPKTLGGSMFYRLIQRALPNKFLYNSLHIMQPMYTPAASKKIFEKLGTMKQYVEAATRPLPAPKVIVSQGQINKILSDQDTYKVPWYSGINDLYPGENKYTWFMLAGDKPENAEHKKKVQSIFSSVPNFMDTLSKFIDEQGAKLLKKEVFKMKEGLNQVDIIRDVAIPLNARMLADLFYLDMKSEENPRGSLETVDFYQHLLNIRVWGFNNNDPGLAFNRRRYAQEGAQALTASTLSLVQDVAHEKNSGGLAAYLASKTYGGEVPRKASLKPGSLRSAGHRMVEEFLARGESVERTADTCWLTSFGGIGVVVTAVSLRQRQVYTIPECVC